MDLESWSDIRVSYSDRETVRNRKVVGGSNRRSDLFRGTVVQRRARIPANVVCGRSAPWKRECYVYRTGCQLQFRKRMVRANRSANLLRLDGRHERRVGAAGRRRYRQGLQRRTAGTQPSAWIVRFSEAS